jgi:hypothetical protein
MTTVHLGVVDVGYSEEGQSVTTGQVAQILEDNYGVMRTFVELHQQDIGDELVAQMDAILKSASQGGTLHVGDIHFPEINAMFRDYLDRAEWEKTSFQPTMAAVLGNSKRKKMPYSMKNKPRPSFIDTGLYQASFRTWVAA